VLSRNSPPTTSIQPFCNQPLPHSFPQRRQPISFSYNSLRTLLPLTANIFSHSHFAPSSQRSVPRWPCLPRPGRGGKCFLFNPLQPLYRRQKSQPLYNQANPASFPKTPGVGVGTQHSRDSFRLSTLDFQPAEDSDSFKTFRLSDVPTVRPSGRYTVSTPASPSCFVPGLPIHTTLHFRALSGSSSRTSSTTCPRLSRKSPCSRNPRSEASTTRQGILFWLRSRLMTRLARFRKAIRFARRPTGKEEGVGIRPNLILGRIITE